MPCFRHLYFVDEAGKPITKSLEIANVHRKVHYLVESMHSPVLLINTSTGIYKRWQYTYCVIIQEGWVKNIWKPKWWFSDIELWTLHTEKPPLHQKLTVCIERCDKIQFYTWKQTNSPSIELRYLVNKEILAITGQNYNTLPDMPLIGHF